MGKATASHKMVGRLANSLVNSRGWRLVIDAEYHPLVNRGYFFLEGLCESAEPNEDGGFFGNFHTVLARKGRKE